MTPERSERTPVEDIKVDQNGDLRCSNCGGKNFTQRRTRRAKVIGVTAGVAIVGVAGAVAPLIARQKLYCQACGAYNRMGSAKPHRPEGSVTSRTLAARKVSPKAGKTSSQGDETAGVFLMTALAIGALIWTISAGSIFWSIVTGLFAVFCIFGAIGMIISPSGQGAKADKAVPKPTPQSRLPVPPDFQSSSQAHSPTKKQR